MENDYDKLCYCCGKDLVFEEMRIEITFGYVAGHDLIAPGFDETHICEKCAPKIQKLFEQFKRDVLSA